ncbi:YkgJ family cysteine cluster protein [Candidatus Woesearchaeota archaeon]|nr:YkgJ family cysteine cluster protein [Candidatus Woesearchaeota archaeon]
MKITKESPKKNIIELTENCKRCGHCCSYGGCYVLDEETDRIAEFLKLDKDSLKEKYLEETYLFNKKAYKTQIISNDLPYGKCIFLNEKDCLLQEVKPLHCKIGICSEHGNDTLEWYFLNYFVDPDDPESIRQWALRLEHKDTIPGGSLKELIPDKERLKKILSYEIVKKDIDWDEVTGLGKLKREILEEEKKRKSKWKEKRGFT